MKSNPNLKHLRFLLLVLLFVITGRQLKSQVLPYPTTYSLVASGNQTLSSVSLSDNDNWFKWTSDSSVVDVEVKMLSNSGRYTFQTAQLYIDRNGHLEPLELQELQYYLTDSTLHLFQQMLPLKSTLYVNLKTVETCTACSNTPSTVKVTFKMPQGCTITQPSCELVQNGGFEYYIPQCSAIRITMSSFYPACFWGMPTSFNRHGTSDYFNSCAPAGAAAGGNKMSTNASVNCVSRCRTVGPHTGNGYAGAFIKGHPNEPDYREYLVNPLFAPIQAGKTYSISMWVRLSYVSRWATQNIQVLLSNGYPAQPTTISPNNTPTCIAVYPPNSTLINMVNIAPIHPITDTNTWVPLTYTMVATQNYNTMTIGNFMLSSNGIGNLNGYQDLGPTTPGSFDSFGNCGVSCKKYEVAYYYFDDVSIREISIDAGPDKITCPPQSTTLTGSLTCPPSGATVTYTWVPSTALGSPNSISTTANPTVTTTYTLYATYTTPTSTITVHDAATIYVVTPSFTLMPSASPNPICLYPGSTTTLSTNAGNVPHTWTNGTNTYTVTNPVVSPTVTTTYTVSTLLCGSTYTGVVTVTVNPSPTFTVNSPLCAGSALSVTTDTNTGISSINFGDQYNLNTANPHTYDFAGNYTVTVDAYNATGGCTTHTQIPISVLTITASTITYTQASCSYIYTFETQFGCSNTMDSVIWEITDAGGGVYQSNFIYPSTLTYTFSSPGTYTITSLAGVNFDPQSSITLTVQPIVPATVTVNGTQTVCVGNTSTLNATGVVTYTWSTGSNNASITVTPSVTTTYTVTGTNAYGCTDTKTITVTVTPGPTITAVANPTAICEGQTSTLTASGASTYTWSTAQTGSIVTVSPTTTTVYTVTGRSGSCNGTSTVQVTVNPTPTLNVTPASSTVCAGNNVVISANTSIGVYTYSWAPCSSNCNASAKLYNVTSNITVTVSGISSLGCVVTKTVALVAVPKPTVTVNSATICPGQSLTLTANGANNYTWAPGGSTLNPIVVTPTATTVYTVTGLNTGCAINSSNTATVSVLSAPALTASVYPTPICPGITSILSASGASSYTWVPVGTSGSSVAVTPTATTVYTVTGDNGICASSSTVEVSVYGLPSVTITPATSTICSTQTLVLTAGGKQGYIDLLWSTGATSQTIAVSPTVTTVYSVTATNTVTGCSVVKTATVNVVTTPTINVGSYTICAGNTATVYVNGATSYSWSTGATTNSIVVSPSVTTSYTVTGSNSGCTSAVKVSTVTIVQPLPGTLSIFTSSTSPVIDNGTGTNVVNLSSSITNTTGLSFSWQPSGAYTPTTAFNLTQPEVIELTVFNTACQTSITSSVCLNYVASNCGNSYSTISSMTLTSPSSLANGTYFVTGTITINWSSVQALEYKTFLMGTGAKVEITPTSDVTFNSMKFYSCNGMWRGIEILTHPSNSATLRLTGDQNVIEDAYMGLYCINPSGLNANPNISIVNLVSFNKNYIDVYLENTKDPSRSYTFVSSKTKMLSQSSNTSPGGNLKCSGYYTPTVKARSYAGLYAKNAGIIDANVSALTADYVQVKNKDYGHYFDNTNANVNNINFADALGIAGPYPVNNSPVATGVGIYSKNSGYLNVKPATTPTTGITTTFDNIGYGIITNGTYNVDVQNTSITSSAHSSTVDPISIYKYAWGYATGVAGYGLNGVFMTNTRDVGRVNNNVITDNYYPVAVNYTLAPSGSNITSVSQNTISTSITGGITEGVSFNSAISFTPVTNNMRIAVNTLSNVGTGVKVVSTTTGLRISNNTILMNHSYSSKGIYLSGSVGVMADNNSITTTNTGTNGAVFNFNQQGILVENSPGCKIQCNTISKTGVGIEFRGSCSSSGDGFFNNTLQYPMRRGLFISNGGIIGTQGSSSGASANQWTGSWPAPATSEPNKTSVGGTIPGGSSSNAANSLLYVHNTTVELPNDNYFVTPSNASDIYSTALGTILTTTAGNFTSCAPTLTAGLRVAQSGASNTAERDVDFVNYVNNVLTSSNADLSPQAKYMLKQYMFDELNSNPSNEQALKAFVNQQQYTSINAYQDVDSLLASGDLNAANTKNAQAPQNNDITLTQNAYNALYIKGITSKSDMEQLQALAELCPDQYGMAVYQARAWLQSITYVAREYKDSCYTSDLTGRKGYDEEGASGITAKEGVQVKLYPNPNNGNFMLAYDLKNEDEAELYLYDVAGKLVYNTSLEKMSYLKQVNTGFLHNGIYFVQIRQNKAVLWTDKLIIQK